MIRFIEESSLVWEDASMSQTTRFGLLGLYRSGSTAAAGVLHHLGADMGAPFWGDYFEPLALSKRLRLWWQEPFLRSNTGKAERVRVLKEWVAEREALMSDWVGCKHPLLTLCGEDLLEAWGGDTRFIWTYRPLDESIDSIVRLNWWPKQGEHLQRTLWHEAHNFFSKTQHLRVEFADMLDDPRRQVARLAEYLNLQPTEEQFQAAVAFIQPNRSSQSAARQVPTERTSNSLERGHAKSLIGGPARTGHGVPPTDQMVSLRDSEAGSRAAQTPSQANGKTLEAGPMSEKIIATILCGNNEEIVGDAVRSVIDWVDEILLIDTGITDSSVEIVKELAGEKLFHTKFQWCNDFALARNTSLKVAAARGATWALTIDTDERLTMRDFASLEELRRHLRAEPEVISWLVMSRTGGYSKERLIRVPTHLEWRGRTHEAFVGATASQRKILPGSSFHETPKTSEAFNAKLERDLVILKEETQAYPDKPRWWYFLGQTLEVLGRHREAVDAFLKCATLDGWAEEAAWACYLAGKSLLSLKEYRQAIEFAALGLSKQPGSPELAWLAGFCCFKLGRFHQAVHWEQIAITLGNVEGSRAGESRISFRYLPGWYEGPYDVLRFAYRKLKMEAEARIAEADYHRARAMRLSVGMPSDDATETSEAALGDEGKVPQPSRLTPANALVVSSEGNRPELGSTSEFRRMVMRTKVDDTTKLDRRSQDFHDSLVSTRNSNLLPSDAAYNLTASHGRRFLWFRVAKVATRTILNHLRVHCGPLDMDHAMAVHYPVNLCRDYYKFAFVRNPWERLVSCWHNKVVEENFFRFNKATRERLMDFKNFVAYVKELDVRTCDHHLRCQCSLIDMNQIEFLGRHEHFDEDFTRVCKALDIPRLDGQRRNESARSSDLRRYYSQGLIDAVYEIYEQDARLFNYGFDDTV